MDTLDADHIAQYNAWVLARNFTVTHIEAATVALYAQHAPAAYLALIDAANDLARYMGWREIPREPHT